MSSLWIANLFIRLFFFGVVLLLLSALVGPSLRVLSGPPNFHDLEIYSGKLVSYEKSCSSNKRGLHVKISTATDYFSLWLPCSMKLKNSLENVVNKKIEVRTYEYPLSLEVWHLIIDENIIYNYKDLKISRTKFLPLFIDMVFILLLVVGVFVITYVLIYYERLEKRSAAKRKKQ